MNKTLHAFAAGALLLLSNATIGQALKVPAPSPVQTIKQAFALSDISLEYSRPSVKGRVIFGDLVPFGKIWRTGANGATKITFGEDVKIDGVALTAGTYAIYSIPNKDSWELMFYKDLSLGGNVAEYKKENEVAKLVLKTKTIADKIECFTMDISDITSSTAMINLTWEKTRVGFTVVADIDTRIMKAIDANVVQDNRPYFQAASYYYESNKDLIKAAEWADKAFAANPNAYWILMLKAKIQAKQKDKKAAIVTAEQVITIATEGKNDDYVKQAKDLIAEMKK
jgi:tetratricopeptide (TPR) repeat protein